VIETRRTQPSFGDGLIAEEVSDLRSHGRFGTPAVVMLRMLVLKHVRNWSYGVLERGVRGNLVYRDFTRVGAGKVPDAKTMGRWGVVLGVDVVKQIRDRIVQIVLDKGVMSGRRMRVDTNCERLKQGYRRLLNSTSRAVGQAKRLSQEISDGTKRSRKPLKQIALEGLREGLEEMLPLVRRVMHQRRQRIFHGNTRTEGKIFSVFEPSTEVIRKGKASKPNEFGKVLKLQEAENQIVVDYAVYARRSNDCDLLIPAIDIHCAKLARVPCLLAADAAFYSAKNEAKAKAMGVKRVCVPNRSTKSAEREREQRKRWFRNGQKSEPDARGESVSPSGDMVGVGAATRDSTECSVGSASAGRHRRQSHQTSAAPSRRSRRRQPRHPHICPTPPLCAGGSFYAPTV
jgi:IS5 family transposase